MYGTLSAKSSPSSVGGTTPSKKIIAPPPPSARELFPQEQDVPLHGPPKPPRSPALSKVHPHPSPSSPGGSVALKRKDRRAPAPPQAATPRSGRTSPTDTINSDSLSVSSFGAQSQTVQGQEGKLWLWEVCWNFYVAGLSVLLLFFTHFDFLCIYEKWKVLGMHSFYLCYFCFCVTKGCISSMQLIFCAWPPPHQTRMKYWAGKCRRTWRTTPTRWTARLTSLLPPSQPEPRKLSRTWVVLEVGACLLELFWDLFILSILFFFSFHFLFLCCLVVILGFWHFVLLLFVLFLNAVIVCQVFIFRPIIRKNI